MAVLICSGVGEYFGLSFPIARFMQNFKIYCIEVLGLPFPPDNLQYKEYLMRANASGAVNNCAMYNYAMFLRDTNDNLIPVGDFFWSITGRPEGLNPCSESADPIAQCNACAGLDSDAKNSSVELSCLVQPQTFEEAYNNGVLDEVGTNMGIFVRGVGGVIELGFTAASDFNYEEGDIFDDLIETFDIACVYNVLQNVIDTGYIDVEMIDCLTELNEIICCTKFPTKCKLLFFDDYTLNIPPIGSIKRIFFRLGFYFPHVFNPNLGGLPLESYCYYKTFLFEDIDVSVQERKTDYQKLISDWVNNFNEIQDEKLNLLLSVQGFTMQNQGVKVDPLGKLEGSFFLLDTKGNQTTFLFNNTGYEEEDNTIQ